MLSPPIKQRVRESFGRAATSYDSAAILQRRVCDRLLTKFKPSPSAHDPQHILDAGCGTGYGTRLLRARWHESRLTSVDFAPAMLDIARHHSHACCAADIEGLPFSAEQFDLWWSSLSIQWCNARHVFAEAARVLNLGGQLAVSSLGPGTFEELRTAFIGIDQHRHTLSFSDPELIRSALSQAGFSHIRVLRETHAVYYPELKTLLRAVKAIGAQNVGEGGRSGMMGRAAWQKLEAAYELHREKSGLPASYDVILAYATK